MDVGKPRSKRAHDVCADRRPTQHGQDYGWARRAPRQDLFVGRQRGYWQARIGARRCAARPSSSHWSETCWSTRRWADHRPSGSRSKAMRRGFKAAIFFMNAGRAGGGVFGGARRQGWHPEATPGGRHRSADRCHSTNPSAPRWRSSWRCCRLRGSTGFCLLAGDRCSRSIALFESTEAQR